MDNDETITKRIKRLLKKVLLIIKKKEKKLNFLLKTKKWNPYCIRHSAITADSDYLPEYALKKKVRWSMNSDKEQDTSKEEWEMN